MPLSRVFLVTVSIKFDSFCVYDPRVTLFGSALFYSILREVTFKGQDFSGYNCSWHRLFCLNFEELAASADVMYVYRKLSKFADLLVGWFSSEVCILRRF